MTMILVLTEKRDGSFPLLARQLLSEAYRAKVQLNLPVVALLPGKQATQEDAATLGNWGADKVLNVVEASLERYQPENHKKMLIDAIEAHKPTLIFLGATTYGKELASLVSGKLGLGYAGESIRVEVE